MQLVLQMKCGYCYFNVPDLIDPVMDIIHFVIVYHSCVSLTAQTAFFFKMGKQSGQ